MHQGARCNPLLYQIRTFNTQKKIKRNMYYPHTNDFALT
jgi:hypothetical protein